MVTNKGNKLIVATKKLEPQNVDLLKIMFKWVQFNSVLTLDFSSADLVVLCLPVSMMPSF